MIPGDLEVGSYDVIVVNPDDTVASLPSGFEVRAAEEPQALSCGDGLCSDGEDCEVCPTDCGVCQEVERPSSGGCAQGGSGAHLWPLLGLFAWMWSRRQFSMVAER